MVIASPGTGRAGVGWGVGGGGGGKGEGEGGDTPGHLQGNQLTCSVAVSFSRTAIAKLYSTLFERLHNSVVPFESPMITNRL